MKTENHSLQGRVAIVTGAGKGLGQAWALHLASLGARLVINNRGSKDRPGGSSADAVVGEIRDRGGEAVANYDSVEQANAGERLVATALEHFGRLDIVIANAGIDRASSFHKLDLEDFENVIEINFLAVAKLLHAAWPILRNANYGRVLLATSTAGLYGNHGQAAYAASKAALQGLMKTLSIEGASRGVLINSIAPYAFTQMTDAAFPEQQAKKFSPEAVTNLVGWLVSQQCTLRGKTFIAGADHARLVQTLETDSVFLGADPQAAIETLLQSPCSESPPTSASAEFETFIRALEGP